MKINLQVGKFSFYKPKYLSLYKRVEMPKKYSSGDDIIEDIPKVEDFAVSYLSSVKPRNDIEFIKALKKLIGLNLNILAGWLNITPRTFKNYLNRGNITLKENLKEHIILILSLYKHGAEVFGNIPAFETWLCNKNVFLDNKMPSDFLDTITGIHFIDNRLTALEFGDNS